MSSNLAHVLILLNRLGLRVRDRFQQTGDRRYLDWVIALQRLQLDFFPADVPVRWLCLKLLAISRSIRYDRWRCSADLDRAIVLRRDVITLCPRDHEDRPNVLDDLAMSLSIRFDLQGKIEDLDVAIQLRRTALTLFSEDHPNRPASLNNLANNLLTRFEQTGNADDLNESIAIYHALLSFHPEDHSDRASMLNNLASSLHTRFEQTGNMDDLDEAVRLHRDALALRPEGHPDWSASLNNLATSLQRRFKQTGNMGDLDEAVLLHRDALALRPEGHPDRSASLHNLANGLQTRFEQTGNMDDLDEAVLLHRDALALRPEGHPDRSSSLNNLAGSLQRRFEQTGNMGDLDEAVLLHRDALALRPEGHPLRSSSLNNLANDLQTRFEQTGNVDDLDEAVRLHRDALALCPTGHHGQSSSLNNLANSLRTRFEQSGNMDDLDESVRLHRDALSLRPEGHPDRSLSLNNLAGSLRTRFEQIGNMDDLDEAVRLHRDALSLFPEGHPYRSASLNNLANSLQKRFEQTDNVDDLDEAVQLHHDALALLPEGHPDRSSLMFNISGALHARFDKLGHVQDFEECIQQLTGAATHTFSSILYRLDAAHRWTMYARRRDHTTTLDAYRTAISLLQRTLTTRPDLSERHDLLISKQLYQTLGVDAASYAIGKGDLGAAVELLEQGRALLWSQMRGLRSPLDRLSTVDKGLADRFAVCCRQLERLMTSSDSDRSVLDVNGGVHVQKAPKSRNIRDKMLERVRKLTEEQDAIINEIRLVPSFEDFLRGARFEALRQVASEGPVIVLNHSEFRCDALIILSREVESCVCVPLDDGWFSDALDLCNDLLRARYGPGVQSPEYDETLRRAMKVVWDRVVSKVVQKLEEFGIAKGSRIWWCPTSYLSLLPFHAAGPYETSGCEKFLLDEYASSYTPTLMSLIAARSGVSIGNERLLFVGDSELCAVEEREAIRRNHHIAKSLFDEKATRDAVLGTLQKVEWVHFACHGALDWTEPFKSSFALPGGRLTLLDLVKSNLPRAEFAFLSACHTAEQTPGHAMEEALHLAAAIQFCGFRSVVGTMWAFDDVDGPILAEVVYGLMNEVEDGVPRFKGAAAGVREAALFLKSLSDTSSSGAVVDIKTQRWVNLVHIGA